MSNNGYIKLHRKILNSPVFKDAELFQLFNYILLKSTHKDYENLVGLQVVNLSKGQMVFGRKKTSFDLGMTEQKIRTRMKVLEELKIITSTVTSKYTLVTVINWDLYQKDNREITSTVTSEQPTDNQQVTSEQPSSNHIQEHKTHKEQEEHKEDSKCSQSDKLLAFDIFYKHYPRKVGRGTAEKKFLKMKPEDMQLAMDKVQEEGFQEYMRGQKNDRGDFRPHPATWLNRGGWLDEFEVKQKKQSILDMMAEDKGAANVY